jgi:ABC-type polysaccharide/polyol phosphate export permease
VSSIFGISNRELIVQLTRREVLSRYRGSVLCSLVNSLPMLAVVHWGLVRTQLEPACLRCIE